ncbi:MAG: hypothetical protein AUH43_21755 [Acidobacteria bacterium 13_1_40CM_65_14]|nr:MAG: hypothetical protein AUH43_21755 [Acidobacteria bacterium 13_1_40CM_65_14]
MAGRLTFPMTPTLSLILTVTLFAPAAGAQPPNPRPPIFRFEADELWLNLHHFIFTAGDAVRRVMPDHVPYAEAAGVWQRGFQRFKIPLEETWKPYLDGRGTRDEALAALVAKTATEPRP